ncbi:MAG: aminopeptidase P family protein [Elusimicrobia bacterium]|nr:aminopeptidase P family protein [Elusimicrobiota bacterium]
MKNLKRLQGLLRRERLDGMVVTCPPDLIFLTDFNQEGFALLVGQRRTWAFVPELLKDQVRRDVPDCRVVAGVSLVAGVAAVMRGEGLRRVGFDPTREIYATGRALEKKGLVPIPGLVLRLRAVKEHKALERVRRACRISAGAFERVRRRIRPGRTERSVALELEEEFRKEGGEGVAFETIVASGPNSALPHHRSCERLLKSQEPVVMDFGSLFQFYRSDMTRTLFLGKSPPPLYRRVYRIVERAQREGIRRLRAGVSAGEVDRGSRDTIQRQGYGSYFIHSTGHGVGLEIHEPPRLGPGSKERLRAGMVVTVEPGIYLPGRFGVRLEDTLLVTAQGSRRLTQP